jgi:hypothetical protein
MEVATITTIEYVTLSNWVGRMVHAFTPWHLQLARFYIHDIYKRISFLESNNQTHSQIGLILELLLVILRTPQRQI